MRELFYLATVFLFFSCVYTDKKQPQQAKLRESKFENLLAKYDDISFDTVKVFSDVDIESNTYKFKGTKLDTTDVRLLLRSSTGQYLSDDDFFACYKFIMPGNKIGLITRTPSTYASTSIKLSILDKSEDKIIDMIELSEAFGDAGDILVKTSWLINKGDKEYNSFTWVQESHDNSIENDNDASIKYWNHYSLIAISQARVDTISTDEKLLKQKFGGLLNGQGRR